MNNKIYETTVKELKKGDTLFGRPIVKVTNKCIYIDPTCPWGKARYTKKEIKEHFEKKNEIYKTN